MRPINSNARRHDLGFGCISAFLKSNKALLTLCTQHFAEYRSLHSSPVDILYTQHVPQGTSPSLFPQRALHITPLGIRFRRLSGRMAVTCYTAHPWRYGSKSFRSSHYTLLHGRYGFDAFPGVQRSYTIYTARPWRYVRVQVSVSGYTSLHWRYVFSGAYGSGTDNYVHAH